MSRADVCNGSRAAVASMRMAQPVYPSSGNVRAFRHLRFVPKAALTAQKADVLVLLREEPQVSVPLRFNAVEIDFHAAA
jgi:hypothetical protein